MLNYWRTTTTELVALSPKAPWVVPKGSTVADPNWLTANTVAHDVLEYDPAMGPAPQRQPFAGVPAGALQEALNAADDMKSIIGIYDASLGARSNETSGRAIMARQREGDVSTFHFIDNLSRAIRHCGRILLDLIPKVYSTERMIRVLGEDMQPTSAQIAPTGQPVAEVQDPMTGTIQKIYDITAGKYDLTVKAGPSYTTMREEHRLMMMEATQAGGEAVASVVIPEVMKLMDLPNADEMAAKLEAKLNPQPQQGLPPEMMEQIQAGMQRLQQVEQENSILKVDMQGKAEDRAIKAQEAQTKQYDAETKRIEAQARFIEAQQPTFVRTPSQQPM
jgi:hypothetical protein